MDTPVDEQVSQMKLTHTPTATPTFEQINPDRAVHTDNGILDFMTAERAIELYKRIHSTGIPDLDWKFYGRRNPAAQESEENKDATNEETNDDEARENLLNQIVNTEFDFGDEDFGDLHADIPLVNESLELKKRESAVERKINLSDIMSDLKKDSLIDDE